MLIAQAGAVKKYFLSEFEFLSDNPVPQSEIRGKPYLLIEYDDGNRVIGRSWYSVAGQIERTEQLEYQGDSPSPSIKQYLDETGQVRERIIFGHDTLATRLSEYVDGDNIVANWADRYTIYNFGTSRLVDSCRFFDSDGRLYGRIRYDYGPDGEAVAQTWEALPGPRIIRRWIHILDLLTAATRTVGTDENNRVFYDIRLRDDGFEDACEFIVPTDSSRINNSRVSYNLYTALESAEILLENTGGASDILGTHTINLYGVDLTAGRHDIDLGTGSVMADSGIYRMTFNGWTVAGRPVIKKQVSGLVFDQSSPVMQLEIAPNGIYPQIGFVSSERLVAARLLFTMTGYTESDNILVVPLEPDELLLANGELFIPVHQPELTQNCSYEVVLQGQDQAGNRGQSPVIAGIRIDPQPPLVTVSAPVAGTYFNRPLVKFTVNEAVSTVVARWEWTGGLLDSVGVHLASRNAEWLPSEIPVEVQFNGIQLQDSAGYRLKFWCSDLAGNMSDTTSVTELHFDVRPPLITSIFPYSDATIRELSVSYVFDEQLVRAEYRWEPVSASGDNSLVIVVALVDGELEPGKKIHQVPANAPKLVSGTSYNVSFTGWDRAGNQGDVIYLRNILYQPAAEY
ncbi:MAG: hypothetical protein ABIA75_07380 [Candidatus Neomarinimicrobiota bacterium]